MKSHFFSFVAVLLFFLLVVATSCNDNPARKRSPLTNELLRCIDSSDVFISRKQVAVKTAELRLKALPENSRERCLACRDLAGEYSKFIADSALFWYDKAQNIARTLNDKQLSYELQLQRTNLLSAIGFFAEAWLSIEKIPQEKLSSDNLILYYRTWMQLYHALYVILPQESPFRTDYVSQYEHWRDRLLAVASPDSEVSMREKERYHARKGEYAEALAFNALREQKRTTRLSSILYDRYVIYHHYMKRPAEEHLEDLLTSAIMDVRTANQNIASLRYVEAYFSSIDDIEAAKKVSDYYYSTMIRFGSRTRLLGGIQLLIGINDEHIDQLSSQRRDLQWAISLIAVLVLALFVIIGYLIRYNRKIGLLNEKLNRSDRLAKGYVVSFFRLYSSNISRLLSLRSKINILLRRGNEKAVLEMTDPSKDITGEELQQMYDNFDLAFLDIYPDYVSAFNALLKPDCRIVLKPEEYLNLQLRVFAIIKMGISDTAQIAELLHCSVKTVYNKRSEINGKIAVSKEEFQRKLMEI
ncbi:MAG: hypothetical protein J6T35_03925 [Bacteroidales bacterium]|nr:hypothetical protein [Bacteroidales bacterium]